MLLLSRSRYNAACTYAQLGDIEVALDLLERTLPKLGPGGRNWAKHDSDLEPLRNHPRFQQLFDRIDKG